MKKRLTAIAVSLILAAGILAGSTVTAQTAENTISYSLDDSQLLCCDRAPHNDIN